MKTRNKILLAVGLFLLLFIVYTLIIYTINGWQWDGLFPYLLGIGGVVDVMTAAVAMAKEASQGGIMKKNRKKKKETK